MTISELIAVTNGSGALYSTVIDALNKKSRE